MLRLVTRVFSLGLSALLAGQAGAQAFTDLYVFGDSLSDIGRVKQFTEGVIPPPLLYYRGRFSNGPIWVDKLALGLGVPLSLDQDYAWGGAESGTGHSIADRLPGVRDQLRSYLSTNPTVQPTALYIVWAGGNDYLDGQTDSDIPVQNLVDTLNDLLARGARGFLVPNLPDLGAIPETNTTAQAPALSALTIEHNTKLQTAIQQLQLAYPSARIDLLDVYSFFMAVRTNPQAYGFTNVTQACLDRAVACTTNASNFLFYDTYHPTTQGHKFLADYAAELYGLAP